MPSSRVVVETGGVRITTSVGEKFVQFTTNLIVAPHDCLVHPLGVHEEDGALLTRISDIRHRTFVGPLENFPLFFLDLIDKYYRWLETHNYFLTESRMREQYLLQDPVKMRLLRLLQGLPGSR